MKKGQKGFSLIELMIVVVIIGLLATVGVPQYQKFIAKTKQSEAKSMMSGIYTAEKAFFAEWNRYYADFRAIGFQPDGQMLYNVGFTQGVVGPATHPNPQYRVNTIAANRLTRNWCGATFAVSAARGCAVSTANAVQAGAFNNAGSLGSHITATLFGIGSVANIDGDATLDRWTLNNNKTFRHTSDDVAN